MWPTITLHQRQTTFNADSVEFVPLTYGDDECDTRLRTFVCGNYQLNEATREKVGRIYLHQIIDATDAVAKSASSVCASEPAASDASSAASSSTATSANPVAVPPVTITSTDHPLLEHQVIDTDAIFDLKWCPQRIEGKMMLGQADASGKLVIYQYEHAADDKSASLTPLLSHQVVSNASCLSLDWNNRIHASNEPLIAVSQSNSAISIWQLASSGLVAQASWTAHEYEMWIVSFNAHTPHILYSGADDCKFRGWDLRQANTIRSALFIDTTHEMGVCSIQSHPTREHILATGSYDESLRLWDTRAMKEPILTHALGGGVWRVRWNPSADVKRRDTLLCCAMHNGFAVVDVNFYEGNTNLAEQASALSLDLPESASASSSSSITSLAAAPPSASTVVAYKAHSSLAYGADWCAAQLPSKDVDSGSSDLVATCSFYDKQLNVWAMQRPRS